MPSAAAAVSESKRQKERARAVGMRRHAMEPLKSALAREGRTQTWLMRQMKERAAIAVTQVTLNSYLNGYTRVRRDFVRAACLIAGANPGDVYARIAGQEAVLFQQEPRGQRGK